MKVVDNAIGHAHAHRSLACQTAENVVHFIHQDTFFCIRIHDLMHIAMVANFMALLSNILDNLRMNLGCVGSGEKGRL